MNCPKARQSDSSPLPGLARLFLFQVYLFLPLFFTLQLAFFFTGNQGYRDEFQFEPVLWQLACLGASVWALSVIIGLHTRAAWAADNSVRYCRYLAVLFAAAAVRLVSLFNDLGVRLSLDYFGMNDVHETLMVVLPALCMLTGLQTYAWGQYCRVSSKFRSVFGQALQPAGADEESKTRPLGVGLLHLLCGGLLIFYLAFFPSLALAARGAENVLLFLAVLLSLPQIVMPALLLAFTWRKGSRNVTLHICFAVWIALNATWSALLPLLVHNEPFGADGGFFYFVFEFVGAYPVSRAALPALLAALWWRLTVSPEDAAWFSGRAAARQRSDASRLRLFLCGYAAYLLLAHGARYLYGLLASRRWLDVSLSLLNLSLLVLAGLAVYRQIKERRNARPACLAIVSGALAFLAALVFIMFLRSDSAESLRALVNHALPFLVQPIVILGGGLYLTLRDQPNQPLPLGVFKIFCLSVACMFILPRLLLAGFLLAEGGASDLGRAALTLLGGVSTAPSYYGEAKMVFSPSFLFAFSVLPLVFPFLLRSGRVKRLSGSLCLALLGIWLLLLYSANIGQLAQIAQTRGNPIFSSSFAPNLSIIGMTLTLFLFYFCSSKAFSRWAAGEPKLAAEEKNT